MTTHPRELADHAGHRRMSLRSRWLRDVEARGAAPLIVGPAVLDVYTRRVMINGYQLRLPAREAALLRMLMLNPDRVLPVAELATVVVATHETERGQPVLDVADGFPGVAQPIQAHPGMVRDSGPRRVWVRTRPYQT